MLAVADLDARTVLVLRFVLREAAAEGIVLLTHRGVVVRFVGVVDGRLAEQLLEQGAGVPRGERACGVAGRDRVLVAKLGYRGVRVLADR